MSARQPPQMGLLPTPYEEIYGVTLLDDIHNYFPELLYNRGRFRSVEEVLTYIAERTEARFNLYRYGRSRYREQSPSPAAAAAAQPMRRGFETPPRRTYAAAAAAAAAPDVGAAGSSAHATYGTNEILYALLSALHPTTITLDEYQFPFSPTQTDVPVVPTSLQILRATSTVTPLSGTVCSVCQDTFQTGERGIRINHCNHMFHNTCINRWFQENVRCPNCNYDIRDDTPPAASTAAPAAADAASDMQLPD